ncbi:MAG TPA: hypothetical protein VLA19_20400 [Herpetosiphonaceae bacterium]|nr:hypothetical protein [Herpetosiphonaceae bacterium]
MGRIAKYARRGLMPVMGGAVLLGLPAAAHPTTVQPASLLQAAAPTVVAVPPLQAGSGDIDPGMVVLSPFNGDPKMAVGVPFNDAGIVKVPAPGDEPMRPDVNQPPSPPDSTEVVLPR